MGADAIPSSVSQKCQNDVLLPATPLYLCSVINFISFSFNSFYAMQDVPLSEPLPDEVQALPPELAEARPVPDTVDTADVPILNSRRHSIWD